ncbi:MULTISPECIES: type II 3-dehydroquinate dehydratase [unclassified Salinivibrio]|uniref:type II 3-dehydroquinate dehydratase n=1 Tax=unclassified Salinivibrio TaxID=2636825 RepID=UPI0009897228|nr:MULTISPECIES: type II 3-dehydroquinate dehydratase [unclassified Salinivibrio]MPS33484.1 type II 3-dehydroquinate dehydratase [Salinivibrio sp. VYel7]MPX91923.1 type II 3-dehydroquinate dehydratase [Salinivibrio sp. VYel1]MPX94868.1 type II 3-dehydroquinate dehydratase [Salinivibrio sp. VYel9]MPX97924.1 type II 3-dehydroquinate dehydratase [Salinivibrio sp. VYel6]MPY01203.1 type II 3-dehydroquinate dehydratase [Salinivibrio sp. VYel4]
MSTRNQVLVLNGPNLNLLGQREPEHYGAQTLGQIMAALEAQATTLGLNLEHFQSNSEASLIDKIHQEMETVDFIIINPAALTHTSVALRDALLGVSIPFIEVHLSNVYAREPFRHHSYLSDKAVGVLSGFGADGYEFALTAAARHLAFAAE